MLVFNVYQSPYSGTLVYLSSEVPRGPAPSAFGWRKLPYRIRCRFKPSALSWCDDQHSLLYDDKVAH